MTIKITISIDIDNDAFQPNPVNEVVRLVRQEADRMEEEGVVLQDGHELENHHLSDCRGLFVGYITKEYI